MKTEIVSQSRRAVKGRVGAKEYSAEVRLGIFNDRYDFAVCEMFRRDLLGPICGLADSGRPGVRELHDGADHGMAFRLFVQVDGKFVCPYPFLGALGLRRDEFEAGLRRRGLAPGEASKILLYAVRKIRRDYVGDMRAACDDLAKALGGRLSEKTEAERLGRPFSPAQCEIYSALEAELDRLRDRRNAAEDEINAERAEKKDEARRRLDAELAAIDDEYDRKVGEVEKEYGGKIAEVEKAMAETAV